MSSRPPQMHALGYPKPAPSRLRPAAFACSFCRLLNAGSRLPAAGCRWLRGTLRELPAASGIARIAGHQGVPVASGVPAAKSRFHPAGCRSRLPAAGRRPTASTAGCGPRGNSAVPLFAGSSTEGIIRNKPKNKKFQISISIVFYMCFLHVFSHVFSLILITSA